MLKDSISIHSVELTPIHCHSDGAVISIHKVSIMRQSPSPLQPEISTDPLLGLTLGLTVGYRGAVAGCVRE